MAIVTNKNTQRLQYWNDIINKWFQIHLVTPNESTTKKTQNKEYQYHPLLSNGFSENVCLFEPLGVLWTRLPNRQNPSHGAKTESSSTRSFFSSALTRIVIFVTSYGVRPRGTRANWGIRALQWKNFTPFCHFEVGLFGRKLVRINCADTQAANRVKSVANATSWSVRIRINQHHPLYRWVYIHIIYIYMYVYKCINIQKKIPRYIYISYIYVFENTCVV